mgnify:FL=1
MNLQELENELKKRLKYPYIWGTRQNNYYNGLTNFIYQTKEFDILLQEIDVLFKGKPDYQAFFNYALNRWYNFWSAQAVEQIFCQCDGVVPAIDNKNRLVDFSINGINFDHKTSVFPKGYGFPLQHALSNKGSLIDWLYENQSQQQRHHLKNRLFIIVYSNDGEHWKVKSEITLLSKIIKDYVKNFDKEKLLKFTLEENTTTLSDIIWLIK